ncbi:MAG: hypothetical protein ABII27_05950 [bacterium]
MARRILSITVCLTMLATASLFAFEKRMTTGKGKFSVGIEGEYSNTPLKLDSNPTYYESNTVIDHSEHTVTTTEYHTDYFRERYTEINDSYPDFTKMYIIDRDWTDIEQRTKLVFLNAAYGIFNFLDGYVKIGVENTRIVYYENVNEFSAYANGSWSQYIDTDYIGHENYPTSFAWGLGFKGKLYGNEQGLYIGADANVTRMHSEWEFISGNYINANNLFSGVWYESKDLSTHEIIRLQYDAQLIGGYATGRFFPYAGAGYIHSKIEMEDRYFSENVLYDDGTLDTTEYVVKETKATLRSVKNISGVVGCEYQFAENASIDISCKYYGGYSINIGIQLGF